MNRQILIMVIVLLSCSSVILGTTDTAKTLQESYHVWTPEPELATAIACQDNGLGRKHPDDPNKHKEVLLPLSVRTAICRLTEKVFEHQLYEGPTKYEDLFGYIYRIIVPDSNNLHLYVYLLKPIPYLSSRYILILHDVINDTISSNPVSIDADRQTYFSTRIHFQDVLGDSTTEILILTGEHHGTDANFIYQHIIRIESGINLQDMGAIKTGIWAPLAFPEKPREERYGYHIVRIIDKMDHNHFTATVSYSKNKQKQGEIILGREVYEVRKNKRLSRSAVQVMGQTEDETKDHNEILMNRYYY